MQQIARLSNPPIVEAQLNFQADSSVKWDCLGTKEEIAKFFPSHAGIYPIQSVDLNFSPSPDESGARTYVGGFVLRDDEITHSAYQVRRDGYAFSQLMPYRGWEHFEAEGLKGWARYCEILQPGPLQTLEVRFINRITVARDEFRENRDRFFTVAPRVPPDFAKDWGLIDYSHTSVFRTDDNFIITICLARDQSSLLDAETVTILLDIIVAARVEKIEASNLADLLQEMRLLKNKVFFSIATPASIKNHL